MRLKRRKRSSRAETIEFMPWAFEGKEISRKGEEMLFQKWLRRFPVLRKIQVWDVVLVLLLCGSVIICWKIFWKP